MGADVDHVADARQEVTCQFVKAGSWGKRVDTRILGKSGVEVSEHGFGGAPLGDLYSIIDEAVAVGTVESALRNGVTLLDTSPLYGHGMSELRIGAALRRVKPPKFVLCTKIGRVMDPFKRKVPGEGYAGGVEHLANFDYSYDGAMRSLEQSMLRMGLSHIDVVLIHDVDVWTHGASMIDQRFREAVSGAYKALDRLRQEKVIRAVGVGVNEADMCVRFARECDIDCVLLAGRYSLLEQPAAAEFLPLAVERRIGVMLGGVFNSGILATGPIPGAKYNYKPAPSDVMAKVGQIEAVCRAHNVALADAALRFALAHPAVSSVVLGAVAPSEIERQRQSFSAKIPAALWSDLKAKGLLDKSCPVPA
ncbi:MAG: aldo/keto reductase [Alphaproteobacteria bacterium]|nr:aldo/keto reductase [Alphaproteobacteria bacterium]